MSDPRDQQDKAAGEFPRGVDRLVVANRPPSPLTNRRVLTATAGIALAVYLFATVLFGWHLADTIPNDFLAFWAAGQMVEVGEANAVYDIERHHNATEEMTGERESGTLPFLYPPTFLFVARALAFFGYFQAFFLFSVVSIMAIALTIWRLLPDRLAVLIGLAVPTTIANVRIGQVGLILAAASTSALLNAHRNPWRSGLALGVLSLKPQLGIGIGIALLCARAWSALACGIVISIGMVLASWALFGSQLWISFFADVSSVVAVLTDLLQMEAPFKGQGLLSIAEVLGFSGGVSWGLYLLFASALTIYVAREVGGYGLTGRTAGIALVSTALIAPRSFGYDFAVMVPAGALLFQHSLRPPKVVRFALAASIGLIGLAFLENPTAILAGLILLWIAGLGEQGHAEPVVVDTP